MTTEYVVFGTGNPYRYRGYFDSLLLAEAAATRQSRRHPGIYIVADRNTLEYISHFSGGERLPKK